MSMGADGASCGRRPTRVRRESGRFCMDTRYQSAARRTLPQVKTQRKTHNHEQAASPATHLSIELQTKSRARSFELDQTTRTQPPVCVKLCYHLSPNVK
eukprot:6191129-Pleurochrysis_carterae.AAC.2